MNKQLHLKVVTPERLLLQDDVDEVVAPGTEGDFGVRPGHCTLLSTLKIGELRYRQGDRWGHMSIAWGYAQVQPDRVTILAEVGERAEDIDLPRAEEAVRQAKAQLSASPKRGEMEAARKRLEKALLRVRIGQKAT